MPKEQNVINYYVICNRLKDTIRKGWLNHNVQRERIESVAEHIFGTQMLAIAMKSEYQYDVDIMKVVFMLAIHELGEAIIGDITPFEIDKNEKEKKEHKAVHEILSPLIDGNTIEALYLEYEARKTPEALFAYQCDKLECDIQCKMYDQEGCVDLSRSGASQINDKTFKDTLEKSQSWSKAWLKYGQNNYPYDENFMSVSRYIEDKYQTNHL